MIRQKAPLDAGGANVVPKQHEFQLTSPADAKAQRSELIGLLRDFPDELTVIVQSSKGEVARITSNGRDGTHDISFLAKGSFESWLGV